MYEVSDKIIQEIKNQDNQLNSAIINYLITEHSAEHDRLIKRYDRYKQDNDNGAVPILSREKPKVSKINNKLPTDWAGSIVDTKIGYFVGNPITTPLDKQYYMSLNPAFKDDPKNNKEFIFDEEKYAKDSRQMSTFQKRNNNFNQDRKITKFASSTGLGARLLYIKQGTTDVYIKNLNPWEVIFIRDRSTGEIQGALRYYPIKDITFTETKQTQTKTKIRVEWYNESTITFYISDGSGHYQLDESEKIVEGETTFFTSTISHLFNAVPVLPLYNNEEVFSDYEKCLAWMDDWDFQTSDVSNTLQQIAQEILITKGFEIDEDTAVKMRDSGSIRIGEDQDIKWLEKNIKIQANEKHLERAKQIIINTAKHIDFNEEAFGGNIPIVAIHFKLFNLISKSTDIKAYFIEMLTEQYKIITDYWDRAGKVKIDYLSIDYIFTPNIPFNTKEEAVTARQEKGILSDETILASMSKVDDVEKEKNRIENERQAAQDAEGIINLDDLDENE